MSSTDWQDTFHRWMGENVADTRDADGPESRVYTVPFARVWDQLLELIRRQRRWTLAHKDEDLGMLTVRCQSLMLRFIDDLTLWVQLDENGLTRVEARSTSRMGRGDLGTNRRRIERLLGRLDSALGPDCRLRERRQAPRPPNSSTR